ncbi:MULTISPECIES: lipopolysaccharide biosynthesis protein [Streptomyces]|uniref:lipopolysaccharide biosynthesis protein n=1 Tax=Streptomyces TaxID=1883 RepID=UPI0029A7ED53|nr:oligosaccharide flippase family protein [Streptomyces sp. ND04-05B]MDX3063758.1 lipopolysaccharide biosynthesis protein [Streptomyces sp. ND04-05B]
MTDTARAGPDADAGPDSGAGASADRDGTSGDSMFRNAYALMLSTGVSAALGLGFWLVAARYYTEEAVGQGSAAIAAMRLLASVTATTMIGAVVRYVPRAGRATASLVAGTYLVSSVVVALVCVVFLLTLDLWGDSYAPLGTLSAGLVFTGSCVAWAVLTLQDGVLTGLRKAVWVPVGNAAFSLGKLLLLAAFATALPVLGVFVSWAAATALSVLPLGWLVFRRLIPRQAGSERDREPPRLREIGRFLAGDSVGALFSLAMINLLPVMVAVRFDAAHNGFFYIAYTVGGTMEFMAINMASSLTAHASHTPGHLAEGVRGALRRMAVLLVPVVLVLVLFAPYILAPFGHEYADHGTLVLRLLAVAALPRVLVELYIGVLRVQGRTGALAVLQAVMCALVLGSAALLLGPLGIAGAGWAMLLSMTAVATASALGLRTALGRRTSGTGRGHGAGRDEDFGTSWARSAAQRGRERRAEEYGADWTSDTVYLRGAHDTVTPAFGIPVCVRDAGSTATDRERVVSRTGEVLWLLLGLAAGLFWVPLVRVARAGHDRLTGEELVDALPPVTVTAGVLMIVVYSAAATMPRPRRALTGGALLVTVAALHSAPLLLGILPPAASREWHGALAGFLAEVVGPASPAAVLRGLPFALQLLCLALVAVLLRTAGVHRRAAAALVWVLAVAGWAAQDAFAAAGLPVFCGLFAVTGVAYAVRARVSGRGPAA